MSGKFKYRILPEYKLIIEKWTGDFDISEIIFFKNMETADPMWREHYDVLSDDTESNKNMEITSEASRQEYMKLSLKFMKRHRAAVVTRLPVQVVGATFMKLNLPSKSTIQIGTFSTIENALLWLGADLEVMDKLKNILCEMSGED